MSLLDFRRRDARRKLDITRDIKSVCTVIAQTIGSITWIRSSLSPRRSTGAASSPHVTHRSTVNRHHDQPLELLGDGRWRFGPLDQATVGAGAPV